MLQAHPRPPDAPPLSVAFRTLFDAEFGYVCRSLRRLGVREADVLDVAQELFLAVHHRLGEHVPGRPVRPWLFAFSLRFAANYRRNAWHRVRSDEGRDAGAAADGAHSEARDLVLRALDQLDETRRAVLVMHDLEGFDAPEIAVLTGALLNTVYSRLRLARADFRQAVARLQGTEGNT
jgi:RNA polymerase sigma-70 factor (ECF subfamily)